MKKHTKKQLPELKQLLVKLNKSQQQQLKGGGDDGIVVDDIIET